MIYAGPEKDVPQPTKMVSILKIHRGDTREYKGAMHANRDANIKGAWVFIDLVESDTPSWSYRQTIYFHFHRQSESF